MYYGITFDKGNSQSKNTWSDWYLVPSSRPSVAPPEPKKTIIEIPGSNGVIDLTEYLTGDVTYGNRKGTWEFIVMNEKPILWSNLYSDIMDFLHGQQVERIFMEDELKEAGDTSYPDWYYTGRINVNAWDTQENYSVISFDYDLDPFKYRREAFTETYTLNNPGQSGSALVKDYTDNIYRMPIVPKFTVASGSTDMRVFFNGNGYDLSVGEQAIANIVLTKEYPRMSYRGSGSVTITFRGGRL